MTLEELYRAAGGDYNDILTRLMTPSLVKKFALKFLEDESFRNLCDAIDAGNREEAFRAAHTLKGVCQNMGFGSLAESTSEITEILRAESSSITDEAYETLERVKRDYNVTAEAIRAVE